MSGTQSIQVACGCGKRLKAPATAAGKKARCPACSAIVTIAPDAGTSARVMASQPAAAVTARSSRSAASPAPADNDGDFDAFAEMARQMESTAPVVADRPRCSQCNVQMTEGAVLCTNCGFDSRTGKKLAVAAAPVASGKAGAKGKKWKTPVDRMAPTGSFMRGLAFSLAFAVAASVVWIIVAYLTGFTVGYIALLIGVAAGLGMQVGQKGYSSAGGYTASGLTLVAILIAKVMVIEIYLSHLRIHKSLFDLNSAKLAYYFFSPVGLIIIAVGMAAAFRTANGSART